MRLMISIYCRGNHANEDGSKRKKGDHCSACADLFSYTLSRIDSCPAREVKDFCSNCTVHCYQPDRREQIRTVMRYSGPRMIYNNFPMAIRHLISSRKSKSRATKQLPENDHE